MLNVEINLENEDGNLKFILLYKRTFMLIREFALKIIFFTNVQLDFEGQGLNRKSDVKRGKKALNLIEKKWI